MIDTRAIVHNKMFYETSKKDIEAELAEHYKTFGSSDFRSAKCSWGSTCVKTLSLDDHEFSKRVLAAYVAHRTVVTRKHFKPPKLSSLLSRAQRIWYGFETLDNRVMDIDIKLTSDQQTKPNYYRLQSREDIKTFVDFMLAKIETLDSPIHKDTVLDSILPDSILQNNRLLRGFANELCSFNSDPSQMIDEEKLEQELQSAFDDFFDSMRRALAFLVMCRQHQGLVYALIVLISKRYGYSWGDLLSQVDRRYNISGAFTNKNLLDQITNGIIVPGLVDVYHVARDALDTKDPVLTNRAYLALFKEFTTQEPNSHGGFTTDIYLHPYVKAEIIKPSRLSRIDINL